MKAGDRFTVNGKEYEAVKGPCYACAFMKDGACPTSIDGFNCTDLENSVNDIIAKEVEK